MIASAQKQALREPPFYFTPDARKVLESASCFQQEPHRFFNRLRLIQHAFSESNIQK